MRKKELILRYIIGLVVFLVVLAVALYLITYSLGYKIDWENRRVTQTGMVFVKANPSDVKVKIAGEVKAFKTPAKIRWILPGTYKLEVAKKGYHTWSRKINVEAGRVEELKSVRLFLKEPKEEKIKKSKNVFFYPDKGAGYSFDNKKINFFSVVPRIDRLVAKTNTNIESVSSNKDQTKVLINKRYVYNLLSGEKIVDLKKKWPKVKKWTFHPQNSDQMVGKRKKDLVLVDLNKKKLTSFYTFKTSKKYQLAFKGVWYFDRDKKKLFLKDWGQDVNLVYQDKIELGISPQKNSREKEEETENEKISLSDLSLRRNPETNRLMIVDDNKNFYQLNERKLDLITRNLKSINYQKDWSGAFVCSNQQSEFWWVDPNWQKKTYQLITRFSSSPSKVNFFTYNYLSYLRNGKLFLIDRNGLNGFKVTDKYKIKKYWPLDKSNILIYTDKNQLIKLTIASE